jgi:deazaflavin-dependent oxidoreductase (nitroreductase family)
VTSPARDDRPPRTPPAWVEQAFWRAHRLLHRTSGGRFLWTPASRRGWGALALTTTGRRSGRPRQVVLAYLEDGDDLVTLAMNGWQEGHPDWWLNLRARADATVRLRHQQPRPVRAREAVGAERERLWRRWGEVDARIDDHARTRCTSTPVVVLGPVDGDRPGGPPPTG